MATAAHNWCWGIGITLLAAGCAEKSPPIPAAQYVPPPVIAPLVPVRSFTIVQIKPANGDLRAQLRIVAAHAKLGDHGTFVQFTAEWCQPCKQLRGSMGDPQMVDAFAKTFILQIVADDFSEQQLEAAGLSVDTIPSFYELDAAGRPTGRQIDGGAWDENIPANMAPVLKKFFRNEA